MDDDQRVWRVQHSNHERLAEFVDQDAAIAHAESLPPSGKVLEVVQVVVKAEGGETIPHTIWERAPDGTVSRPDDPGS